MRLSFDLVLDEENDNTKEWRDYFSKRLQAALSQVIIKRPFSLSFMELARGSSSLRLVCISDGAGVV